MIFLYVYLWGKKLLINKNILLTPPTVQMQSIYSTLQQLVCYKSTNYTFREV